MIQGSAIKPIFTRTWTVVFTWITLLSLGCGSGKYFPHGTRLSTNQSSIDAAGISYTPISNISVDSTVAENAEIGNFVRPYSDSLNHSLSTRLAEIDSPFYNTFYTGNLGRLVADYMLLNATDYSMTNIGIPCHFAVANNGGLRTGLFPGPVTMRNIFEVMPFDNELVILQLSGGATDSLLRYIAQLTGTPVSGLVLEFEKAEKPAKNRVVNAKINSKVISTPTDVVVSEGFEGHSNGNLQGGSVGSTAFLPFDSRRDYLVATSSYMAMGGDGFTMLKGAKQTIYTGIQLRDVIANGMRREYSNFHGIAPRQTLRVYSTKGEDKK
jgi:2',3'-cyclic-nucleotide 2'-phosphodiesterase (5'-nucleotidase family)